MANASEILGDNKFIHHIHNGNIINIYPDDDKIAKLIKNYIISSYYDIQQFDIRYKKEYNEYCEKYKLWRKHGSQQSKKPKHMYHRNQSAHLVELKVNHYRQKYWYWKKLKK